MTEALRCGSERVGFTACYFFEEFPEPQLLALKALEFAQHDGMDK